MTSAKTQEKLKAQYVRLAQDSTSIKKSLETLFVYLKLFERLNVPHKSEFLYNFK